MSAAVPVLDVGDLRVHFETRRGTVYAVNGVSYTVARGASVAVVGESGSGKTVSALALMGLLPSPPARVEAAHLRVAGRDVTGLSTREWQELRGRTVAMVFQDPLTSLNPVLTIGRQMTEGLRRHRGLSRAEADERARELLHEVGIPDPGRRLADHPHEFSGGQRQRIGIAMALACDPAALIADEPTTALDVTVQAQIVDLVARLRDETGTAVVWITHDLALVAGFADDVLVMYGGTVVEAAPAATLYARPAHPYTRGLLDSLPDPSGARRRRLPSIDGAPPSLRAPLRGCPFAPRCPLVEDRCRVERPPLLPTGEGARSACWRWEEVAT